MTTETMIGRISRIDAAKELGIDPDRVRNYELEQDLQDRFDREYVITEWCPNNGVYCKWIHYCSESELSRIISENRGRGVVDGYNLDYLADYVERELLSRRPEVIPESAKVPA